MDRKIVSTNRKAFHEYHILEKTESGIVLAGHEVKSLRTGTVNLVDGMVRFNNNEAYLEGVHIAPYKNQSTHIQDYDSKRARKLLMHKNEIVKLYSKTREKGFTIVPLEIYFSPKGTAKVTLGLAKGKHTYDKRESIKRKDMDRDLKKALKQR